MTLRWICLVCCLLMAAPALAAPKKGRVRGTDKARTYVPAGLERVKAGGKAVGGQTVTELRFYPGRDELMVIAEKRGLLRWVNLETGADGAILELDQLGPVGSYIEEGLLSFVFHPEFAETKTLFTSHTDPRHKPTRSVITRWVVEEGDAGPKAGQGEEVLGVLQPDKGHHGGQLQFGPDGFLYLGLGDGGGQRDPDETSQDTTTFMGSILRIDIDTREPGRAYAIPADNPFADGTKHMKEVWAYGLRNPWRFSFSPAGALVVADVGQDAFEEINLVQAGGNYGWSVKEGRECFAPARERRLKVGCDDPSLKDPLYANGRADGGSIIGGYVYGGSTVPALAGQYVFGDNTNGRIWAMKLPEAGASGEPVVSALGEFNWWITTFGQGPDGELYVAGWDGRIFKLAPL